MAPRVVIVGAPGSGKSSVGRHVAAILELPFRDTDEDIEAEAGESIADMFVREGEDAFREVEQRAVARALREHPGVLALGGGAVLAAPTREALAGQRVAWLRVSAGEAAARVGLSGARPLLVGNVRSKLVALLAERTPLYEAVAEACVDTDGRSVEEISADIVEWLGP